MSRFCVFLLNKLYYFLDLNLHGSKYIGVNKFLKFKRKWKIEREYFLDFFLSLHVDYQKYLFEL